MDALRRLSYLITVCSSIMCINAQDTISISSTDFVNLRNEITYLKDSLDILGSITLKKDSLITISEDSISKLIYHTNRLEQTLYNLRRENISKDSIIAILQSKAVDYDRQKQLMQENVDRNIAKLANGRLYFRYSDKLVQSSIKSLMELKTEMVKKDFNQALPLLQNYKSYSEDVKNTFIILQKIDRAEWRSKHRAEDYKRECYSILEQSLYYKNIYININDSTWSIPYLDNLINAAKRIISRHNPVDAEFANFVPLIEML